MYWGKARGFIEGFVGVGSEEGAQVPPMYEGLVVLLPENF